jgi:flagellar basal-body rod protein FlgB
MDINQLALFRTLAQRLDWLSQRQTVLAQNVANADTPGYRPQDLEPFERHLRRAGGPRGGPRLATATTDPNHLSGRVEPASTAKADRMPDAYESAPGGNEVVLEQQMMNVAETAMHHQMALNLYRKHVGMIRMALGRGGQ